MYPREKERERSAKYKKYSSKSKKSSKNFDNFRDIFINPATNDTWVEGDKYKRLNFAQTLRRIAASGIPQ